MPALHESAERLAEAGGEAEGADGVGDLVAFLARAELRAEQRLGAFEGGGLGEVDDVDRRLVGLHQVLDQLVQRFERPREVERDGALGGVDEGGLSLGAVGEVLAQVGDVAERRAHQQELGLGEHEDRHLPRPAPLRVGVEVELVHHDLADVGVLALAQGDVGQDLGGAGDDRRAAVDRRVAGEHADVLGAEDRAQGEELLADERLDRGRVVRDLVGGHGREVRGDRDHRLAAAGRRGEDHVVAAEQLDRRFLLVRIQLQALLLAPRHERLVEGVGIVVAREGVDEAAGGHADQYGRIAPRIRGEPVPTGCVGPAFAVPPAMKDRARRRRSPTPTSQARSSAGARSTCPSGVSPRPAPRVPWGGDRADLRG